MESELLARYIGCIRCHSTVDEAPMAKALRKGSPPHLGKTCFHKPEETKPVMLTNKKGESPEHV